MQQNNIRIIAALGFPIGVVTVFFSLVLFTGGVGNALSLVFVSILCTLGVALIFWVPFCTGVGMLVVFLMLALYRQLRRAAGTTVPPLERLADATQPDEPTGGVSRNAYHQAVADYIRKARAKGYSDSQIDSRLAARGWEINDIAQARRLLAVGG
ncbi:MAG: hypothetical protein HC838_08315 [Spirulinaceae cyanobacterium RM2_2_10]|nr:hypothetical protein [Spirulinaceae cyanobacterium SM2_1_0]NJO20050.1 hypothetical protein [Spirulinaceae cyanobacterium RM2_2_10]